MKIVHLTAHLGGGVGCALLGIAKSASKEIEHCFICLEIPEKKQFADLIKQAGYEVIISPDQQ